MNKKILIVDDDPAILEITEMILAFNSYEVQTSSDVKFFEKLTKIPDLIILDVFLSDEDGRQIVRKIRTISRIRDIPVVMFSADPAAARNIWKCGANDFISKPFEIEDLLKVVRKNIAV